MIKKIRGFSATILAIVYLCVVIFSKVFGNSSLLDFFKIFVPWVALLININTHYLEEKNAGNTIDKKKIILVNLLMLGALIVIVFFINFLNC